MSSPARDTALHYDVEKVRADFPVLSTEMRGKPLVFLDTAASAQKPRAVLDAMHDFHANAYASVHRGVYQLSADSTRAFEAVREKARAFVGAASEREIVFVRNTTEAINLVARAWGDGRLAEGDEIVVTEMEHHANIVPWQMTCERTGAVLRVAPIDDDGVLDLEALYAIFGSGRVRLLAITHVSNVLGTVPPLREIVREAKKHDITVLVDGAQAAPHEEIDVRALGCDFYAFSGHKLYGPGGASVLYGKLEVLDSMPPFLGGGAMIDSVSFEKTTYAPVPQRFEAGTPDIGCVIGLGAAIDYVTNLGIDRIAAHEHALLAYANDRLAEIDALRIIGSAPGKASVVSFVLDGVHPHDIGTVLDGEGVAIRAGHHCAQPLMQRFGVPATARASFAAYNTREDVDRLVAAIRTTLEIFG